MQEKERGCVGIGVKRQGSYMPVNVNPRSILVPTLRLLTVGNISHNVLTL